MFPSLWVQMQVQLTYRLRGQNLLTARISRPAVFAYIPNVLVRVCACICAYVVRVIPFQHKRDVYYGEVCVLHMPVAFFWLRRSCTHVLCCLAERE